MLGFKALFDSHGTAHLSPLLPSNHLCRTTRFFTESYYTAASNSEATWTEECYLLFLHHKN